MPSRSLHRRCGLGTRLVWLTEDTGGVTSTSWCGWTSVTWEVLLLQLSHLCLQVSSTCIEKYHCNNLCAYVYLVYWDTRPFSTPEVGGARAQREKGLAQVTFNWISTDQSDSTTQIWSVIKNLWGFTVSSSWKITALVDIISARSQRRRCHCYQQGILDPWSRWSDVFSLCVVGVVLSN